MIQLYLYFFRVFYITGIKRYWIQFLVVFYESLSHVWLFTTSWTEALQAPLSSTITWSLLKFMFVELVMLSNHVINCHPLSFCLQSFLVCSIELAVHIRWPKYWSFSVSIGPSNEYSGLISFRIDWFHLLEILVVYVFYLLSQTSNLSFLPSPLVTKSVFSMSVSLFPSCEVHLYHILDSTYKWYHAMLVLFLSSLSMITSRSIHVAANGIISFFCFGRVIFHCIYVAHLIYPFICWWDVCVCVCVLNIYWQKSKEKVLGSPLSPYWGKAGYNSPSDFHFFSTLAPRALRGSQLIGQHSQRVVFYLQAGLVGRS